MPPAKADWHFVRLVLFFIDPTKPLFAPHDAQRGRKLRDQIDEAIRLHEKLLLILSPDSIQSKWVETEIVRARRREKREGVQVLFPVSIAPFDQLRDWECFDADTGEDL